MFARRAFAAIAQSTAGKRFASKDHLNFIKQVKSEQLQRPSGYGKKSKQEKIGVGGFLLLGIPLGTAGLGVWQMQRKQWKENLIATLASKTNTAAVPLPENLDDLDTMEYKTVTVKGHFLHDKEMLLGPRALITADQKEQAGGGLMTTKNDSTTGFLVITPFKLANREETILINRGWVSAQQKDSKTRPQGQIEGTVKLDGVVRHQEVRPQFTPEHKGNLFFYRDILKMAKQNDAVPIMLDAKVSSTVPGGPIGGQTRVTMRNEHLSYIVTWFSLSAFTSWMWYTKIYKVALVR